MASDVDDILKKMMKNRPAENFKDEWTLNIAGLWTKYGSKKFLGKKGMKLVKKTMQDAYVMMSIESDRIESLKAEINKIKTANNNMDTIKLGRANDQLSVSEKSFSDLYLRYKFLSAVSAIQDLSNGGTFIKKINSLMKNKKNLNALQQASKSSLMEGKEIEKNLESLEVYLDVIKDGKRPEISPTQIQKQDTMEPKNEQESKEDEDGDVMIS
jgi:hypothetical protein